MKTILLIDDDESILTVFRLALEQRRYRVITAASGNEGLAQARLHLPDLVLCDIKMPNVDGRKVLQALRENPKLGGKQVVLITGSASEVTQRESMDLGADDFLVKPVSIDALIQCIEARLKRATVHRRVENRLLKRLRSAMSITLPQEFFMPLGNILGLVEVLRGDLAQLRPVEVHEILDNIERSGQRLHRVLKNYLLTMELGETPATRSPTSLHLSTEQTTKLLHTAAEAAAKRHRRTADVSVAVESDSSFLIPPSLPTLVEELVDNACSFSRQRTPVTVWLSAGGDLIVADRGRGMSAQEIEQIGAFRRFDPTEYEQQGLGLGLVVVQKLAAQYGSQLELQSEPGRGTRAAVKLPTMDCR